MLGESKQGVQRSPFETQGGHASRPPAMLPVAGSPPTLSMMRLSARGRVSRPSLSCARPLLDTIGRHTRCFEPCGLESSGLQCTGPSLIRRSLNYSIPPPSPVEASERSIGHRSGSHDVFRLPSLLHHPHLAMSLSLYFILPSTPNKQVI